MENNLIDILNYIHEVKEDGIELEELIMYCINENKLETYEKFQNSFIEICKEIAKTKED